MVDKPVVRDGEIVVRSILSLTCIFDHDVVDGGPAARFATTLRELVEAPEELESLALPRAAEATSDAAQ